MFDEIGGGMFGNQYENDFTSDLLLTLSQSESLSSLDTNSTVYYVRKSDLAAATSDWSWLLWLGVGFVAWKLYKGRSG